MTSRFAILESDNVRSVLAYATVMGGLVAISMIWAVRGSVESERLAAILVGLMGGVLGYYFGSRGVEHAEREARDATSERDETIRTATSLAERLDAEIARTRLSIGAASSENVQIPARALEDEDS